MALFAGKKRVVSPTGRKRRTMSAFLEETGYRFRSNSSSNVNPIKSLVGVLEAGDGLYLGYQEAFRDLTSLEEMPPLYMPSGKSFYYAFYDCEKLGELAFTNVPKPTNVARMFGWCSSIKSIPLMDTSECTSFQMICYNCFKLESVPAYDTSKVTDFSYAFYNCSSLVSIPKLDTSKVTNFSYAFKNCYSLTKIEKLDISQNKSFQSCFQGCSKLAYANFVGTAPIKELGGAFSGCKVLPNDCFPTLDVTNLTELWWAYANCYLLEDVKWTGTAPTIKGVVNSAFNRCYKLKEIPEMDLSDATLNEDYSFAYNCSSLTAIHAKNIPFSLNIGWSTKLEREALVEIIGNLKDMTGSTTKTLTLGSTLKAKLTADDIKVATDKNWTVA